MKPLQTISAIVIASAAAQWPIAFVGTSMHSNTAKLQPSLAIAAHAQRRFDRAGIAPGPARRSAIVTTITRRPILLGGTPLLFGDRSGYVEAGFPFRSLWSFHQPGGGPSVGSDAVSPGTTAALPGWSPLITHDDSSTIAPLGPRVIPTTPSWPGFISNTLIYSAAVSALILPFGWRKRRSGECVHCGYRVKHRSVCSECGAVNDRER